MPDLENDENLPAGPELIFGLVGPIGVDIDFVIESLQSSLNKVGYDSFLIHITKLIEDMMAQDLVSDRRDFFEEYSEKMSIANNFRERYNNNEILSHFSIANIRSIRLRENKKRLTDVSGEADKRLSMRPLRRAAYIIRQLKTPEECGALSRAYGNRFIQISIYGDEIERRGFLIKKIKNHNKFKPMDKSEAEKRAISLMNRDNNEKSDEYGQNIENAFHLADVFIPGINRKSISSTVDRFIQALFGSNAISPTKIEYGMYAAASAALRSLDLSRQVGCAIFSKESEIISLGANEVPKAFGGTYWCDDPHESHRDYEEGEDPNYRYKVTILRDIISAMISARILSAHNKIFIDDILEQALDSKIISNSKVMDIIEFGRIIHAEMSAITDAARNGRAIRNSVLFCTTFPCHICAKHIVSAGVSRVIFLEPYPKSYAKDLHADSITFNPIESEDKVLFQPFIGIAPRRYKDIFDKKKRKDKNGKRVEWTDGAPLPRIADKTNTYITNEDSAISQIQSVPE